MEGILCCRRIIRQLDIIHKLRANSLLVRKCSTEKSSNEGIKDTEEQNVDITRLQPSGFAQAYKKFATLESTDDVSKQLKPRSFASMLRHSKFIDLGDPEGKVVVGEIFNVVGNDLYIDFGWKFHCVCPKPKKNSSKYVKGSKVNLRIKDLELSTRFLGATTDLTILEADCVLLNLISSPLQNQ
ncbi:mitochondrial ribosomal protein S28 [Halictus rubicundus]|uniref:mitochondrial ribosomal protein S28 n=1 Tax=Halictus rubicundus TaxID=77578 RepID=UPI004035443C